jgi:hypothetical protein
MVAIQEVINATALDRAGTSWHLAIVESGSMIGEKTTPVPFSLAEKTTPVPFSLSGILNDVRINLLNTRRRRPLHCPGWC